MPHDHHHHGHHNCGHKHDHDDHHHRDHDDHDHGHNHGHDHDDHAQAPGHRMGLSVVITLAFVVGEVIAGAFAHSLALMSDAGHNFADALALLLSWYAISVSSKPSNRQKTFGYHRVAILSALVNAVSLVVIALIIFWEAIERLKTPHEIHTGPMIVMAAVAIMLNGLIAYWLHHGAKHDVNVRSAYLHMLGDAVSALGVVIAGVIIRFTGNPVADVIASFVIGALILWSSWGILKETVDVLLESAPAGMNMSALEKTIQNVRGVTNVHDLHVWTVGPGVIACSCHLVVAEQTIQRGQEILREVVEELEEHYKINHTTVQVEAEKCHETEMYCRVEPSHQAFGHHGHHH